MNKQSRIFDFSTYDKTLEKINHLLGGISDKSESRVIEDYWRKASNYIAILYGIDTALEHDESDEESMSDILIKETDYILQEGKKLEDILSNGVIIKKIKKLFRECIVPIGLKSKIVKHAFMKPSGYAGDFGLIEIIYNDKILSRGFGYCVDKRFQMDDYARAVRSRKNKMKEILAQFLKSNTSKTVQILNIACGSCREIRELFEEYSFDGSEKVVFTLVDQDQDALDFSREALKHSPHNVEYHFLRHSVYDYVNNPDSSNEELNNKDLVYTIGLADYIPDQPLKILIAFLFRILKPGGKLVIAHKDSKNFSPLAADWWCDWTFHLRNESETVNLVKSSGIAGYSMTVIRETETNIIFFMIIEKNNV